MSEPPHTRQNIAKGGAYIFGIFGIFGIFDFSEFPVILKVKYCEK